MARMSAEKIINYINGYVAKCYDQVKSNWYVGIATEPRSRLFNDHHVDEDRGCWAFCTALDESTARDVEKKLLELGFDGGPGGGDVPIYVYAFHKESYTDPSSK